MPRKKKKTDIIKKRAEKKQSGVFIKAIVWTIITILFLSICGILVLGGVFIYLSEDLPKITSLTDYKPPIITTVYSDDNRKIAEFFNERRIVLPLAEIPEILVEAFVAAEDSRFYQHQGVDFISIIRAFYKNIEAGTIVQGGSTITQQVTKSFLLSPERSYTRKLKEAILAYRIDRTFSKEEILFLYLNQIYLGHGAYGVEAAAGNYFGKSAKDLNLAECAILAGLPQAPSKYSPFRHPERAKQRQIYALNRMVTEGYITNLQATEAINTPMDIKPRKNWYIEEVPFYTEHVRRYIEKAYGRDILYNEGLQIYTAVNIEMQKISRAEIGVGLRDLDKRQGFRGPEEQLKPEQIESFSRGLKAKMQNRPLEPEKIVKGVVIAVNEKEKKAVIRIGDYRGTISFEDMSWAKKKPKPEKDRLGFTSRKLKDVLQVGDVIQVKPKEKIEDSDQWRLMLEQTPIAESALMCIEVESGYVKSMVGGRDFRQTQFNRAIQSRRQPGSAFKPIIYGAAMDRGPTKITGDIGYTPATMIIDSPIVYHDKRQDIKWKPHNYKETYYGPTLVRKALAKSRNVVTIKILEDIGIEYTIEYAHKIGIKSELARDLSIALGSSGVSLLELMTAYSVFANQGYLVQPVFITKIVDRDGNIVEEAVPEKEKVIEKNSAFIITSLLESVVKQGTGYRAKALKRPVAGKTGTTNNLYDAWFVGYSPQYITGSWVGFDEGGSLGRSETGARAACPIWVAFMQKIHKDKQVKIFPVPEGVVFTRIDAETGLLPISASKETIFECFKEGMVPTKYTKKPGDVSEPEGFFKTEM